MKWNRLTGWRLAVGVCAGFALTVVLAAGFGLCGERGLFGDMVVSAQGVRPIDRRPRPLAPRPETSSTATSTPQSKVGVRPTSHSLDGLRNKNILALFSREEVSMYIRGFGRPVSYLVILRQLDLTAGQKSEITGISRRIGNRLVQLRIEADTLDQQLEEAIYGQSFDRPRTEDLARRLGEAQAAVTRLQAEVETEFREILTSDQFFAFRALVGEMLLPARRVPGGQLRQQGPLRRPGTINGGQLNGGQLNGGQLNGGQLNGGQSGGSAGSPRPDIPTRPDPLFPESP